MSYILDALRKSERARRLGRAPVYRDGVLPAHSTLLRGLSLAAGVILLAALGVSVWLLNRSEETATAPTPAPVKEGAATTAPAPVSAVLPASPGGPVPDSAVSGAGASGTNRKPPSSALATSRTGEGHSASPAARTKNPSLPSINPAEAPWLSALPDAFRASLPALIVNIHVYAPDEGQRILYINNRPLQRGEEIEGVVVEEIVPEGVVLRARGQRFRLPRPS